MPRTAGPTAYESVVATSGGCRPEHEALRTGDGRTERRPFLRLELIKIGILVLRPTRLAAVVLRGARHRTARRARQWPWGDDDAGTDRVDACATRPHTPMVRTGWPGLWRACRSTPRGRRPVWC